MVNDPTSGDDEPLDLFRRRPALSRRGARMLEELARLMDMPREIAVQVAIANTLHHLQGGHAVHMRPLIDPSDDPQSGSDRD